MTDERVARARLSMLPPIRRSRLWRLYSEEHPGARPPGATTAGLPGRFLDFWMDGGRSLLGAKGTGIGTAAKAAVDMGLTRPFPSVLQARLEKAILGEYPGYSAVCVYANEDRARAAAARLAPGLSPETLRPFAPCKGEPVRVAMPLLPCPAALSPAVLLFKESADAEGAEGDLVPPLLLASAHRALVELSRFRLSYDEALWRKSDRRLKPFFERQGPYLYPRCGEAAYEAMFATALGAGALLSPRWEEPSIVPGDFDDGELAALARSLS
jgi:hypothetical protein